ncbi:hypothetical protein BDV93DRAFT_565233 [Ceratobasidium sp. AG-I]|nr:hypothetical protein BDV93DRAFT_565233 [Ceratobasidium sp. AG-I]
MEKLQQLNHLLNGLPSKLPCPPITSYSFSLDEEDLEDLGVEGATNQALENTLGLRANGLVLQERGAGLLAVVDILAAELLKCPHSAILEKWINDLISAAQDLGATEKDTGSVQCVAVGPVPKSPKAAGPLRKALKSKPKDTCVPHTRSLDWADPCYDDTDEEDIDYRKGGATLDPRVVEGMVPCWKLKDGGREKKMVRCLASIGKTPPFLGGLASAPSAENALRYGPYKRALASTQRVPRVADQSLCMIFAASEAH